MIFERYFSVDVHVIRGWASIKASAQGRERRWHPEGWPNAERNFHKAESVQRDAASTPIPCTALQEGRRSAGQALLDGQV